MDLKVLFNNIENMSSAQYEEEELKALTSLPRNSDGFEALLDYLDKYDSMQAYEILFLDFSMYLTLNERKDKEERASKLFFMFDTCEDDYKPIFYEYNFDNEFLYDFNLNSILLFYSSDYSLRENRYRQVRDYKFQNNLKPFIKSINEEFDEIVDSLCRLSPDEYQYSRAERQFNNLSHELFILKDLEQINEIDYPILNNELNFVLRERMNKNYKTIIFSSKHPEELNLDNDLRVTLMHAKSIKL
ncbi:MAG: hypothetical protein Q4C46_03060 [Bacillota bacterium]|nr:hypothetical protein [Bacillota bacterium]